MAEEKIKRGTGRFWEIISILRKHKIIQGLTPLKLRLILEDLGPMFVKLGQIMSTREDILSSEFCLELAKLRTFAQIIPFGEIERVLQKEFGKDIAEVFQTFEANPIGSASIAQVHAAVLKDGKEVVVKVQKPDLRQAMDRDIVLLRKAAAIGDKLGMTGGLVNLVMILDEMWMITQQEMDFLIEADNLVEFAKLNSGNPNIACPAVYRQWSTANVLVMEKIDGIPIGHTEELKAAGYNLKELGEKLIQNYVKQVLEDAFFHADPHPDNIFVRNGQIVWIDMGMMGRISERDRTLIKKALVAIVRNDVLTVKDILLSIGIQTKKINHVRLYADIDDYLTRYGRMTLRDVDSIHMGEMAKELMETAQLHGISIPKGITGLGRGILILETLIMRLDPETDFISIVTNSVVGPSYIDLDWSELLLESGRSLLSSTKKAVEIPSQLSDLLKMTAKGYTKLNFELNGSEDWYRETALLVSKCMSIILAASLIIGASILSTLEFTPTILGLPLLAFVGYLLAFLLVIKASWKRKNR